MKETEQEKIYIQSFGCYLKNAKAFKYYYMIKVVVAIAGVIFGYNLFVKCFGPQELTGMEIAGSTIGSVVGLASLMQLLMSVFDLESFINSFTNPDYLASRKLIEDLVKEKDDE